MNKKRLGLFKLIILNEDRMKETKLTAKQAVKMLKDEGVIVTEEQAEKVFEFMRMLAHNSVSKYLSKPIVDNKLLSKNENNDIKPKEIERTIRDLTEDTQLNQGRLTIDELRKCKGFEEISESEGTEIIESLFRLAVITFNS